MIRKKKKKYRFNFWHPLIFLVFFGISVFSYLYIFQIFPQECANSRSCKESLTLKVENDKQAIFQNHKISAPKIDLTTENQTQVLGIDEDMVKKNPKGEKHIYVNLATQMLSAYEGNELFMQTPISSGLWGKTPTGEFTIWIKLRSTTMSGGSGADYYYLPNVPYVMFFSNDQVAASRGFSLHGTYWHNNFGHPMSHGCVNMKITDVAKLYEWANPETTGKTTHSTTKNPGTKITIYEGT